ncbi:ATP-dependent zinc metalloprotease FTSH 9, chloroplastic [Dorcoceras hygrometricum]|uniref:ATP-dependent zinc metalloprotease FTSH 9, chloroplastic n=1 Tax=Dorcoceras hygrometricum TaxID=472368 RepID=A0A2Z7CXS4_9LAMI|nr:ATP-dependent zinc metalloprotease FTSH 9, chloroplastic [Dorcoceras hygrometricum]
MHAFKKRHSEQLRCFEQLHCLEHLYCFEQFHCFGAIARHPKWLQHFDRTQPSRTARRVPGINRCTVSEKSVWSDLEYTDRFDCPDQLGASDQIAHSKWHGAYQHADPPLSVGRHSLRGQLSLRWSTQLATVNSAWGLNTTYDLKQLVT